MGGGGRDEDVYATTAVNERLGAIKIISNARGRGETILLAPTKKPWETPLNPNCFQIFKQHFPHKERIKINRYITQQEASHFAGEDEMWILYFYYSTR